MHIKFWGVRGSTPTPQRENMRYGGNTSCVEVRVNGHIFDASWQAHDVTLEDIVLAYLGRSADASQMGQAAYQERVGVPQRAEEARQ